MAGENLSIPLKFDNYGNDIVCPNCGNGYLHHESVGIWDRGEDAVNGKILLISGIGDWNNKPLSFTFADENEMTWNPSPRRGGIRIQFSCECCSAVPVLAIYQHKGCTNIEWTDLNLPEEKPKRQPIKPSLRFEILKRDDYRCQMCGVTAKDGATLEIDHIHPVSKCGSNEPDNLQVLCRDCNAGKSDQWQ